LFYTRERKDGSVDCTPYGRMHHVSGREVKAQGKLKEKRGREPFEIKVSGV
jgi:hypothetical protein